MHSTRGTPDTISHAQESYSFEHRVKLWGNNALGTGNRSAPISPNAGLFFFIRFSLPFFSPTVFNSRSELNHTMVSKSDILRTSTSELSMRYFCINPAFYLFIYFLFTLTSLLIFELGVSRTILGKFFVRHVIRKLHNYIKLFRFSQNYKW